jgi:hypothetical protein
VGSGNAIRTATKISAKIIPQHTGTPHFVRFLISEILTFGTAVRKLPRDVSRAERGPLTGLLIAVLPWCDRNFVGEFPHFVRDDPDWTLNVRRSPQVPAAQIKPCNADASYADAPSCVCAACAWRFLISVFSLKSPFRFSDLELAIQPLNPQHCNSVSFVRRNDRVASLGHVLWLMCNHDHALPDERNSTRLITSSVLRRALL